MNLSHFRKMLPFLLIGLPVLGACSSADPPAPSEPVAAEVADTSTTIPTVALITATPTSVERAAVQPATPTLSRPTATPTPNPTPTPIIYVVEEYDTLLGIAIEFDTTIQVLTQANGISEDDFLLIGQELIIPTGDEAVTAAAGEQIATATELETSTQASTIATPKASLAPIDIAAQGSTADQKSVPATTTTSPAALAAKTQSTPASPLLAPAASPSPKLKLQRAANINPLTGLPVDDPAKLRRRPLLVRIGNDAGARTSQAGLNSADIVYEEITEWWVTRFTAIFLAETPNIVAPVRSARLINVQLAPQYQGALAHSGGSDPVRWEISQAPLVNLDEYFSPQPYYYRPNQGWQTRLAIDTEAARNYMVAQGSEAAVSLQGFLFEDSMATGDDAANIFIPYPRATTFTQWRYDPGSGKYLRFAADQPLVDANLGQVAASNVIVYFTEHQETDIVEDSNGATSIRIIMNGQGPAWFFRDGKLNKGFWQTDGTRTPYFGFEDGSPYPLKPGNTWIEVVPSYFKIGLNSASEASSRP